MTGQGKGKGIYEIDPNWLKAKTQNFVFNDFGDLSQVNGAQVRVVERLVFGVHNPEINSTGEWVANFPMATEGTLKVEIFPRKDFENVTFALTDHFSISADSMASRHAVFSYIVHKSEIGHQLNGNSGLKFELKWQLGNPGESKLKVSVNNRPMGIIKMRRYPGMGLNYLRINMQAADSAPPWVRSIAFEKNNE